MSRTNECDAAIPALDGSRDSDATLTIGAEENNRLLARAFALEERPRPSTDDEITIAAPAPVLPVAARVTQRPPPLKMLVLTSSPPPRHTPPAVVAVAGPPASGWRPRVTPARAARLRAAADAGRLILKTNPQLLVVAGIWAAALSLIGLLALIVTRA